MLLSILRLNLRRTLSVHICWSLLPGTHGADKSIATYGISINSARNSNIGSARSVRRMAGPNGRRSSTHARGRLLVFEELAAFDDFVTTLLVDKWAGFETCKVNCIPNPRSLKPLEDLHFDHVVKLIIETRNVELALEYLSQISAVRQFRSNLSEESKVHFEKYVEPLFLVFNSNSEL